MTKIRISPLFVIMAALLIFLGYAFEFISYFCAVILHEMAHAEIASKRGYTLNGIKLMPYGASLTGEFEGLRARDEVYIAIAGPAFNLILSVACIALWWIFPNTYMVTETFVYSNFYTAALNLMPVFPLDGGRIALALLSCKFPRNKVYSVMRKIGIAMSFLFGALFLFSLNFTANPTFATFALFIIFSTVIPDKRNKYTRLYSLAYRTEKLKHGLPVKYTAFSDTVSLGFLMRSLNANCYNSFIILDCDFKTVAVINENQLENLLGLHGYDCPISDAIKSI